MREPDAPPPQSPGRRAVRELRRNPVALAGGALLVALYAGALLAPFLAPYGENDMDRARFYHPPTRLHWREASGRWHVFPFVYLTHAVAGREMTYAEDRARPLPLTLLVRGAPYRLLGLLPSDRHLFGVAAPGRVYLLGADEAGRDELSRLLYGSQVSLTVGLLGITISFGLGLLLGGLSGYLGGWVDTLIMRGTELLLSIPALYLIVALRGVFPLDLPSRETYLAIVGILAFIGWAALARVIRGMVLSIRSTEYVAAAEALGMGRMRVLVRHILPNTLSFTIVAATVAVPGYILGEVFLSFIGAGVQPPSASWGNMLNAARGLRQLQSFPWLLLAPGGAILVTVLAFNFFGDGLRDALDPRRVEGSRG
ncbi:MAG TPA: ABC transporter permease [Candidatus Eisenbacteria bacterium]|nr:ABC transporter permease [Candidatus Eisenbacteria bacterium]